MAALFFILAAVAGLFGVMILSTAASAFQEAVGGIFLVIGAVLFSACGIINSIDKEFADVMKAMKSGASTGPLVLDRNSPSGERPLR